MIEVKKRFIFRFNDLEKQRKVLIKEATNEPTARRIIESEFGIPIKEDISWEDNCPGIVSCRQMEETVFV